MTASELRPLSVGEILDQSFGLYRAHFGTLIGVVALCSGGPLLVNVYLQSLGGIIYHPMLFVAYLAIAVPLGAIGTAATVFIISESYLGRQAGALDGLRRAGRYLLPLIACSILATVIIMLGTLLLVVPGVILLCGLVLATPAIVLEPGVGPVTALGRSWALTKGSKGRMFLLGLACVAMLYIPVLALGTLAVIFLPGAGASLTVPDAAMRAGVVIAAVTGLVSILLYPIFYCVLTIAYYDLRVRKEGFDLEMLASNLNAA